MDETAAKRYAGEAAALWVTSGMTVGLGTGSTTAFTIKALGKRIRKDGLKIVGVPTSSAAAVLARAEGIPLCSLNEVSGQLDMAVDGADEVDPWLNLIKGRGAAHTQEKIVASQAKQFIVVIDPSKEVDQLGLHCPVPIEVMPMASSSVLRAIEELDGSAAIRMGVRKDGPVVTDQGFWVIDAHFDGIEDPEQLDLDLISLPGVLDHGLFVGMANDLIIGKPEGIELRSR